MLVFSFLSSPSKSVHKCNHRKHCHLGVRFQDQHFDLEELDYQGCEDVWKVPIVDLPYPVTTVATGLPRSSEPRRLTDCEVYGKTESGFGRFDDLP